MAEPDATAQPLAEEAAPLPELADAILAGDIDRVKFLLDFDAELASVQFDYRFPKDEMHYLYGTTITPLMLASALNNTEIVSSILSHRPETLMDAISTCGLTAVHMAARFGSTDCVNILLDKGGVVNQKMDNLATPLHVAALAGYLGTCSALLDRGANVGARGEKGKMPHMEAAHNGNWEVVCLLLEWGADTEDSSDDQETALLFAATSGHTSVIQVLLEHKADIHKVDCERRNAVFLAAINDHTKTLELLIDSGADYEKKSILDYTPLIAASRDGKMNAIKTLLQKGASIERATSEGITPLMHAASVGSLEVVELLLDHGAKIDNRDNSSNTALTHATDSGNLRVMGLLMDRGANKENGGHMGGTPLLLACNRGHKGAVEMLVGRGANLACVNAQGLDALHHACIGGKMQIVKLLLDEYNLNPNAHSANGSTPSHELCWAKNTPDQILRVLIDHGADVTAVDNRHRTVLHAACGTERVECVKIVLQETRENILESLVSMVDWNGNSALVVALQKKNNLGIVLELLGSRGFFPRNPVERKVYHETPGVASDIAKILIENLDKPLPAETGPALESLMFWAIVHGEVGLMTRCLAYSGSNVNCWSREGCTWLHVAAFYGQFELIKLLLPHFDVLGVNSKGSTALHLATLSGVRESVAAILKGLSSRIEEEVQPSMERDSTLLEAGIEFVSEKAIRAIMMEDGEGESCISLAVIRGLDDVAAVFWKALEVSSQTIPNMDSALGNRILEMLARFEKPGKEEVLTRLFKNSFPQPAPTMFADLDQWTALHHATYHDQLIPAWWLLSNGGHSSRFEIKKALAIATKIHGEKSHISTLLQNIPQVQSKVAVPEDSTTPISPDRPKDETDILQLGALVIDFYRTDKTIDLQYTEHSLDTMIYGQFRGRTEKEHRSLLNFLNRSWTELVAGGRKNYMKPQVIRMDDQDSPYKSHNLIHATSNRDTNGNLLGEMGGAGNEERQLSDYSHPLMTLDQYYYSTLADTTKRDCSQVLTRYLDRQKNKKDSSMDREMQVQTEKQSDIPEDQSGAVTKSQGILGVDQLWIWIIDEETIISASSNGPDDKDSLLRANIEKMLAFGEMTDRFDRPDSVESLMELMMGVATGLFMHRCIPSGNASSRSPLEVFQESIRYVTEEETTLFDKFLEDLYKEEASRSTSTHDESPIKGISIRNLPHNPYHIIIKETKLLDEIKDIRDELNILTTLATDQEKVWKQVFGDGNAKRRAGPMYSQSHTPIEIIGELGDITREAEMVHDAINTLLELRQQQASIKESEFGRLQANDSARQSNTVMVFTLVTIVFLPLSFLSSLFALNITDFPHKSGSVEYDGWWIFPILFGVSAVISIPCMIVALYINDMVTAIQKRKRETHEKRVERSPSTGSDGHGDDHTPRPEQVATSVKIAKIKQTGLRKVYRTQRPGGGDIESLVNTEVPVVYENPSSPWQ
ncbi:Mg2+ transporter protein CorA-like/Zinc transport protein ZntB [Penicillium malachiteum]|nr:Mg2+ transporter protein CorA-like/Zinc transport protein ZntB [Penicillium malachiteum]